MTSRDNKNLNKGNIMTMTIETIDTTKSIIPTLAKIDRKEKVFFNIVNFTNFGLVKSRDIYYTDAQGNKQREKTVWSLTEKGKRILTANV